MIPVDGIRAREALGLVYDILDGHPSFTGRLPDRQTMLRAWENTEVLMIEVDGRPSGAVMLEADGRIHVAISVRARRRWLTRQVLRDTIGYGLRKYGELRAVVHRHNAFARSFVQRLGFIPFGVDGDYIVYSMTETNRC